MHRANSPEVEKKDHESSTLGGHPTEEALPKKIEENERWTEREVMEMNLRTLREFAGKTQVELAQQAEMTQSEASRAERRDDHLISTLKRYVEALGGKVEIFAVFDHKRIKLRGV